MASIQGAEDREVLNEARLHDKGFWEADLRLGEYEEIVQLLDDDRGRLARVRASFTTKRILRLLTRSLGLSIRGTSAELQARVAVHAAASVHFLLVARFAPFKMSAAVIDIAEAVLNDDDLDAARIDADRYDRLALLLLIYLRDPASLVRVRGLNAWHRKGAAPMMLQGRPAPPNEPIERFLAPDRVTEALRGLDGVQGEPRPVFEMVVTRRDGSHLLFLRRNLRRAYHWSADGRQILHGHDAELIVLHFLDGGQRVRISSTTSSVPRRIADRLASVYFGRPCTYEDDQPAVRHAQVENLLAAITDPDDGRLPIVELLIENSPLAGGQQLMLSAKGKDDIIEQIDDFEARVGDLLEEVDDIARVKVRFGTNRVSLFFPKLDGVRVVEFGDSRLDNNKCAAFVELMRDGFGIEVRSHERKGGAR